MQILSSIYTRAVGMFRKFSLSDIDLQDVRADEIALERREKKLQESVDNAQEEIDEVTQTAIESGKRSQVRRAVRKIMQTKERMRSDETELAQISRQLIALSRLRRLVEGRDELAASGVLSRLEALPSAELEKILSGAIARSELENQGLNQVADLISLPPPGSVEETDEARHLREAMEAAIDAQDPSLAEQAIDETATSVQDRERIQ